MEGENDRSLNLNDLLENNLHCGLLEVETHLWARCCTRCIHVQFLFCSYESLNRKEVYPHFIQVETEV